MYQILYLVMVSMNLRDELGNFAADFESMNAEAMEEYKGGVRPKAVSILSVDSEEAGDTFDSEAAQLGKVNLYAIVGAGSTNRRLTSMNLINKASLIAVAKPPAKQGKLKKYSPALFKGWQNR